MIVAEEKNGFLLKDGLDEKNWIFDWWP